PPTSRGCAPGSIRRCRSSTCPSCSPAPTACAPPRRWPTAWARSCEPMSELERLLAAKEIVVTCGSGGVGKTTTAAALGTMAAVHLGGKVLVLTVDPARRLATAMGLEEFGNLETKVPTEAFVAAGVEPR